MPVTVRLATLADEAAAVALWRACGLVAPYNDPAADFRFALAGASSAVLVLDGENGGLAGSVMVGHDGHRGWLYYVAAAPAERGRGVGRLAVDAATAWLAARGVRKAQLLVRDTNLAVIDFYRRLGFEVAPSTVMARWLVIPPED